MIRHKIKAFTLVELIVVITILAVLGTIAFVSFQGYAQSSRDSARITDLRSIEKVLALYKIDAGFFPDADNAVAVTYLTSPIWSQGTFGENARAAVKRISDIPTDPLTGTQYAYSTTYSKNEFEVGATFEGEGFTQHNVTSLALAGDRIGTSYVNGEYNGQLIQKEIGGILYVLAVPTIINANMDLTTLTDIVTNGTFAINGSNNLADSYSGTTFNTLGGGNVLGVNPGSFLIFSGNKADLTGSNPTGRDTLLTNLQAAYSGTVSITANPSSIGAMMAINLGNSSEVESYASSIVNNSLGANITIASSSGGGGGAGATGTSCRALKAAGNNTDGIYTINSAGTPFDVYCNMTDKGGGWTLIAYHYDSGIKTVTSPVSLGVEGVLSDSEWLYVRGTITDGFMGKDENGIQSVMNLSTLNTPGECNSISSIGSLLTSGTIFRYENGCDFMNSDYTVIMLDSVAGYGSALYNQNPDLNIRFDDWGYGIADYTYHLQGEMGYYVK